MLYLIMAPVTDSDHTVARVPQMPATQLLLDLGVGEEQPPGRISLEDLDRVRKPQLRLGTDQHMDVIRHHFHHIYGDTQLLRRCL